MSILNIQLLYRRSKRFPLIIHHLLPDLAPGLTFMARTTHIEQISMVPKRFEPSKFDCMSMLGKIRAHLLFTHLYKDTLLHYIV